MWIMDVKVIIMWKRFDIKIVIRGVKIIDDVIRDNVIFIFRLSSD